MIQYENIPISRWALEERPREKLMMRGISALTDGELIAIILGSGTQKETAIGLARKILDTFGSLERLAKCDYRELMKISGIGKARAIAIVSAFELARRRKQEEKKVVRITQPGDAAHYLIPRIGDLKHEVFYVMFLNRNNVMIAEKIISSGGVSSTIIDPKLIFKEAIDHLASAIIVSHNHPSGNLSPSPADTSITRKLKEGANLLDIKLLDHLIVSETGYYSFKDETEIL